MTDDTRAKALKLCRDWHVRRTNAWLSENTSRRAAYDKCINELAQAFGITWAEVGRKEQP